MKRAPVNKANWSETREISYKAYCDQILFKRKLELIVEGNSVYLNSGERQKLLLEITKPKAMWYETWLKLKAI